MQRTAFKIVIVTALICATSTAMAADTIDSLKGQFTFNWFSAPDKTTCKTVDDKLLGSFKSDTYECDLTVITNTASGEPARVCKQKDGDAEYLIFASEKSCELERETQVSNAD